MLRLLWSTPISKRLTSLHPTVLMYHGIPRFGNQTNITGDVFDGHIKFLNKYFDIVPFYSFGEQRQRRQRHRVILTFDDGFRNNAEVAAPILEHYGVPATFFISSYHSEPGKYLWFSYLRALEQHFPPNGFEFRGRYIDMSLNKRTQTVKRLWNELLALPNHPLDMYKTIENELPPLNSFISLSVIDDMYAGMTASQVRSLSNNPDFTFGIHTDSHPFLSNCDPEESRRQIESNMIWLEKVSSRKPDVIAYPIGDYDNRIVMQCQDMSLNYGASVTPLLWKYSKFEIPRIGIYNQSIDVLGIKAMWAPLLFRLRRIVNKL